LGFTEEAGRVQIGTRLLPGPQAVAGPEADGTLLAIVPIPGTGTSLAIVGYPVSNQAASRRDGDGGRDGDGALGGGGGGGGGDGEAGLVAATGLLLDHEQRRVWADGTEVSLTYQEFELLAFLVARPATVFSRADLVTQVWQREFGADSRTVDVHVSRLRHKLGPRHGRCLVTEYRVGYQFRPAAPEAGGPPGLFVP
jgi:hypothetical protein